MRTVTFFLFALAGWAQIYQPPEPRSMWDTWVFAKGDEYHLFFLQSDPGQTWNTIGRAVSKDLIHWQTLPAIETRGPAGAWDAGPTLTGITVESGGRYLMFYAAAPAAGQSIGVMESTDLVHWRKSGRNPLLVPRPPYYGGADWRDLFVVRDAKSGVWHGYVCARTASGSSAIAHLTTTNLFDWKYLPPVFASADFADMEVPEHFELGGRHYLLFSSIRSRKAQTSGRRNAAGTFYLMGDRADGPYHVPAEPLLLGAGNGRFDDYVGRTMRFGRETLLYSQTVGGAVTWATPKVIRQNQDGSLWLGYWSGLEKLAARSLVQKSGVTVRDGSAALFQEAGDFMLECELRPGGATKAGLQWRQADGKSSGVVLDRASGVVAVLENGAVIDDIRVASFGKRTQRIRALVRAHRAEVYLNDRWLFNWRLKNMPRSGAVSLTATGGEARFSRIRLREIEPPR